MKLRNLLASICFVIFGLLLNVNSVLAHKVNVFAYVEDGKVYCESYFPDGRPVAGGAIVVSDSQGLVLVTGKTDSHGMFDFQQPKVQDLNIVIKASMGHQNSYLLKKEEME